jgi:hypothetical protein
VTILCYSTTIKSGDFILCYNTAIKSGDFILCYSKTIKSGDFILCYSTIIKSGDFFLSVTVPPEKLVIMDEKGSERTSVVGPYSEGADLVLRCDVYGGKYMHHALHCAERVWMRTSSYLMKPAAFASPRACFKSLNK